MVSTYLFPALAAMFLLLLLFRRYFRAMNLLGLRIVPLEISRCEDAEVPTMFRPVFEAAGDFLSRRGFEPFATVKASPMVAGMKSPSYGVLYQNEAEKTYAVAWPSIHADSEFPAHLKFYTLLDDGRALLTVDGYGHEMSLDPPAHILIDAMAMDPSRQLDEHRRRVAAASGLMDPDPDRFLSFLVESSREAFDALPETRGMAEGKEGAMRFTLSGALRFLRANNKGEAARAKALAESGARFPENHPARVASDVFIFRTGLEIRENIKSPLWVKWGMFALTGLFFVGGVGLVDGFADMAALLLVLLAHEFGHYLGMLLSGYRNRHVIFLPFMGMAAIGENPDPKPMQELFILFMGPVPGLLAATLIILFGPKDGFIYTIASMAIYLNVFNLIPVYPLDGGRIVEVLLISKRPRIRAIFSLASGFAFLAFGLWAKLTVFQVLALLTIPSFLGQWRIAKAINEVRARTGDGAGLDEKLVGIFTQIAGMKLKNRQQDTRLATAGSMLRHLNSSPPRAVVAALGLVFYVAVFIAPAAIFIRSVCHDDPVAILTLEERYTEAETPNDRYPLLLEMFDAMMEKGDRAGALGKSDMAEAAVLAMDDKEPFKFWAHIELARRQCWLENYRKAGEMYDSAFGFARTNFPPDDQRIFLCYVETANRKITPDRAKRAELRQKAFKLLENGHDEVTEENLWTLTWLASRFEEENELDDANRVFDLVLQKIGDGGEKKELRGKTLAERVKFHFRTGQYDKALAATEAESRLAAPDDHFWRGCIDKKRGYALMAKGRYKEARDSFALSRDNFIKAKPDGEEVALAHASVAFAEMNMKNEAAEKTAFDAYARMTREALTGETYSDIDHFLNSECPDSDPIHTDLCIAEAKGRYELVKRHEPSRAQSAP